MSERVDTASRAIARWVVGDGPAELPPPAIALVKRAFVDTIAVTLLGARMDAPRIAASLESPGRASIFGMGRKADVRGAALVNGTSATRSRASKLARTLANLVP